MICKKIKQWGLDKSKVVGLGFDGAANMSGKFNGVQARFETDVSGAHYVHCRAHSFNLAIVHTCQQPEVRNMYGVVSEVVTYIGATAKRLNVFIETFESSEHRRRLKKLCATRWTCHEETLRSYINNLDSIVETLELLTKDTAACSKATSHLNSVLNFQFLITFVTVEYYLKFTKPLSLSFQSADYDLVTATESSKELVDLLQERG